MTLNVPPSPEDQSAMQTLISNFAETQAARRPDGSMSDEFPMDLWRVMGEAGLFKIGIEASYGGLGGGFLDLLQAGETFVQSGFPPGLAVSWLYQQILARFIIAPFGTPEQRRKYLPALASGKTTLSFAVSEPGRGAHPKMLAAQARRRDNHYELCGEKTYLTNGPIADVFIVIAVTDDTRPRKHFTAFIVPRETSGLTVGPALKLNFLKPSLHGSITLDHCQVAPDAVLGAEGSAWEKMVVGLGDVENVVMMGAALGGMSAQWTMLVNTLRHSPFASEREVQGEIGNLRAGLEALKILAYEAAGRLDETGDSAVPLCLAFDSMALSFQAAIASCVGSRRPDLPTPYAALQQDMESLAAFRTRAMKIRREKIGRAVLEA